MLKIISLENNQPIVEQEKEVVIYVKIGDPAGLEQAFRKEEQLQGQIKTNVGSIRVRRVKNADSSYKYEQTTKIEVKGAGTKEMTESTLEIDKEHFEQFLGITPSFMDKTRYCFKAENISVTIGDKTLELEAEDIIYEVDVFRDKDGNVSEWCKIDIEIQNLSKKLKAAFGGDVPDINLVVKIAQLPFKPNNFILEDDDPNPKKKELITALYETQFLIKNPALTDD